MSHISSHSRATPLASLLPAQDATRVLNSIATPPPGARATPSTLGAWHLSSTEPPLSISPQPLFHKQLDASHAPYRNVKKRSTQLPPLRKSAPVGGGDITKHSESTLTEEAIFLTHGLFSPPRERLLLYKEIPDSVADLRNALLKHQLSDLLSNVKSSAPTTRQQAESVSHLSHHRVHNASPFFGEPLSSTIGGGVGASSNNLGRRSYVGIPRLQKHSESHVHLLFHERMDYEDDLLYATFEEDDHKGENGHDETLHDDGAATGVTAAYRELLAVGGGSRRGTCLPAQVKPESHTMLSGTATTTNSCFRSDGKGGTATFALPTSFVRFAPAESEASTTADESASTAQHYRQKIIEGIVETQRRKAIESALSVGVEQLNAPPKQIFLRCDFVADHGLKRHQFRAFCGQLVESCVTKPLIESVTRQLSSEPSPLLTDETPFYNPGAVKGGKSGVQAATKRRRSTKLDLPATSSVSTTATQQILMLSDYDRSYLEQVKKLITVSVCDDDPELLELPRTLFLCVAAPSNTHISLVERVANNIQHTVNTKQHSLLELCKIVDSPYESSTEYNKAQMESPRDKDFEEYDDLPPEEEGWSIEVMPPQRGKWELWALETIQARNKIHNASTTDEGFMVFGSEAFSAFSSRRTSKADGDGSPEAELGESGARGMSLLISEPSTTRNPAEHQQHQKQQSSRAGSASSSRPLVDLLDVSVVNTDGGQGAASSRRDDSGVDFFQVARRQRRNKNPTDQQDTSGNEVVNALLPAQGTPRTPLDAHGEKSAASQERSFSLVYGTDGSPASPITSGSASSNTTTTAKQAVGQSSFYSPSNSTAETGSPAGSPMLSGSRRHSKVFGAAVKNQRLRRLASISGGGEAVASIMSQVDCGAPVAPLIASVKEAASPTKKPADAPRPSSASSTDSLDDILLGTSPGDSTATNSTSAALDLFGVQSEYQTKLRWVSAHQAVAPESIITGRKAKGKGKAKVSLEEVLKQRLDMLMTRYGLEQRPNPGALSEQNVTTVRRCAGCIFDRPHAFCTQCGYLFCTDCFYFIHRPRNETFMWYSSQHPGRIRAMVTQDFLQHNDFEHTAISVESLFRSAAMGDAGSPATASTTSPVDVPVMATAVSEDANSTASRSARKVLETFRAMCSEHPESELATVSGGGLSDEAFRLAIHNVLAQLEERLRVSCAEATPSTEFKEQAAKASPGKGKKKKPAARDPTAEQKRLVTGALDAFHPTQVSHLLEVVGRFQLRVPPTVYRLVMGTDEHTERRGDSKTGGGRRVSTISRLVLDGKGERRASIERGPHLLKEDSSSARRKSGPDDTGHSMLGLRIDGAVSDDDDALAGLGEPVRSPLGSSISRFELDSDDEDEQLAAEGDAESLTGKEQSSRGKRGGVGRVTIAEDTDTSPPAALGASKHHKSAMDLKLEKMRENQPEEAPMALFYEESEEKVVAVKAPPPPKPLLTPAAFLIPEPEPVGPTTEELQKQRLDELLLDAPEKYGWYHRKVEQSRTALAGNAVVISIDVFEDPTITKLNSAALEGETMVRSMVHLGYSVDWMKPSAEVPFLRPTTFNIAQHIRTLQKIVIANDEIASRKLVVVMLSRGILARPRCFGKQQPKAPPLPPPPLGGGATSVVQELLPPYQLVALAYDSVFSDVDGSLSVERCVTSSMMEGLRDEFDRPPLFVMDCWPLRNAAHSLDEEGLGFGLLLGRGTVLKKEKVAVEESNADVTNAAADQQTSPGPIGGGGGGDAGGIAASAVSPTNSVNESDDPQSPTMNSLAQQALVETVSDDELGSSQKVIAVVAGGDIAEEVMRVAPIRLAFSYLPHQGGLMAYYLLRALEGRSLFSRVVMSHAESSPKKIAAKARTQGWSVKHRPPVKIEDYEVSAVDLYAFISRRVESKGARFLFGDELASANAIDADDPPVASTPSVVPQGAMAAGRKKKSIAPTSKPFVADGGGGGGASPQRSTSPAKSRAVSPPFLMRRPSKLASVTINRLVAQRETMRKDPFIAISDDSVVPALSFPPAIVTEMMRLSMTSSGNPFAEQKNIETMFHLDEARRFHVTMWTRCDVPQQLGGAPLHRTRSALEEAAVAAGGVGAAAATAPTLEEDTIYNNRWRRNLINMFQLAINGSRGVTRNGRMIQVVGTRCECSIILDFGAGWMDEPGTWKRIQTFLDNGIADAERITGKQKMFSVVKTLREGIVQIVCTHVDFRAVLLQTLASHERRAASKGLGFPRPNVWASIIVSILGTRRDFRRVRKMVALQSTGSHLLLLRNVESDPVAENYHAVVAKIQAVFRARKVRTFIRNVDDLIEREERVREMHESQFSAAMDEVAMLLRDAQEQELTTLEVASRDELTSTEIEEFVQLIDELKECLGVESLIGRREIYNVEEQEWMKLFEAPNRWMIQSAEEKRWAFMLHSHKLQFRQVWQRYYIIIEEYQERIRLRTDARAFVVKLPKLLRIPGFFSMQLPPCDFDVASSLVMFPPNFKTLYQKAKRAQEEPPQDF